MKKDTYQFFSGGEYQQQKYNNNPIHKYLINGFLKDLVDFAEKTGKKRTFEVGCGEGQLMGVLYEQGYDVAGMDLEESNTEQTLRNFRSLGKEDASVSTGDLYTLTPEDKRIQGRMLICCEVLEHVPDPEKALKILSDCTDEYFIVSVPREPLWCLLNILRGKYLKHFGNTPGHINHWTKRGFVRLVSECGEILEIRSPLPWTMILARKRQ